MAIGLGSLLIIIFVPKISKKIPGSLIAIIFATLFVWLLKEYTDIAGIHGITTIADLYDLPSGMPAPKLPSIELKDGQTIMNVIQELFPAAFTIAMLGAIESLLSAIVADGVIGDKHNSNTELIGQGIANIASPFFIYLHKAVARTMTNINNGGASCCRNHTRIGLLFVLLLFGNLVGLIPMPCSSRTNGFLRMSG